MSVLQRLGVLEPQAQNKEPEVIGDPNIDPIESLEAAGEAMVEAAIAETDLDLLQASYEAMEEHLDLVGDLVAKRPDDKTAAVVAYESFRINLKVLGVDPEAVTTGAGYEDITAGFEEEKSMLQKLWAGIKEAAKKAWEAVVKFVQKVVDFVMGLFGKGQADAERLEKLLAKLKEEGKVELPSDAKFEEKKAEEIARFVGCIKCAYGNVTKGEISKAINSLVNTVETYKKVSLKYGNLDAKAVIALAQKGVDEVKVPAEVVKVLGLNEKIKGKVVDYALINKPSEIKFTAVLADEEKLAKAKEVADDKEGKFKDKEAEHGIAVLKALQAAFSVQTVKVAAIDMAKEVAKDIKPLSFADAEAVVKELKAASEKAGKSAKEVKNEAKKTYNEAIKALKEGDKDDFKKALIGFVNKVEGPVARAKMSFAAEAAAELAKTKIAKLIQESAALYTGGKKDEKKEEGKEEPKGE